MKTIVLENQTTEGETLQATFAPEKGLNLISFKKGSTEVIEQSTWNLFDERYAGLGALIGPHFHRRRQESIPKIQDEALFPHIARVRSKGVQDPFSHGIARYAPWKVEATPTSLKGVLTGKDTWNDLPLSTLEGQNFKMEFKADLQPSGLLLNLSIVSDTDSLVGIHYYYALPGSRGRLITYVQNQVRIQGQLQPVPPEWSLDSQHKLIFDLSQEADFTFRPYPNPLQGDILLETDSYALRTRYACVCEENCWQLYHPADASFVCIEPISSQDPRHPNLSISELQIHLEILNPP
ncbi:conserved hypothetical protein [Candidatus Protochlamydia naegleriophila]|uniref:Aldose 1-epimerase n=1 Tax=Candidatus Protochlamydia naegleriophila TaxID=389348 RepID=A0A0U5JGB0_9BACT|nr:hypothetical protein [Candidatus Protochlamydia naegleriophila]CUI17860.1 conserved hypothetical protein [Candidatus Protochlamydia naegleriophila]